MRELLRLASVQFLLLVHISPPHTNLLFAFLVKILPASWLVTCFKTFTVRFGGWNLLLRYELFPRSQAFCRLSGLTYRTDAHILSDKIPSRMRVGNFFRVPQACLSSRTQGSRAGLVHQWKSQKAVNKTYSTKYFVT